MSGFINTNLPAFGSQLWETLIPLLTAVVCGGVVGLERESANRPAGLRTHVLVCVGSALVMQVSFMMAVIAKQGGFAAGDPGRVAAQVVSGIGFLGAGTIMREGANIRGLTTAASLWVVSAIGLAAGAGMYTAAIASVVLVVLTLKVLSQVERRWIAKGGHRTLIIHVADSPGRLGALATTCGRWGANIRSVSMRTGHAPGTVEIAFHLQMSLRTGDATGLIGDLMAVEGVVSVTEEE